MATLIVFVDALPFDDLACAPRLAGWPTTAPLLPGFGYSINLHAELFAGLTPDEVGFFGEWTYDPAHAPGRSYARALPALNAVCRPYVLNRGLQALLTARSYPGRIMPNLPLARLGDYAIHGYKVLDEAFPAPTVFSLYPDLFVVPDDGLVKGGRDRAILERSREWVTAGARRLYVPFLDLDGIGHTHRRSSAAWHDHIAWLGGAIDDLATAFLRVHADGDVFVVSDHGMADVAAGVPFAPERWAGPQGRGRYLVFTDSTLLRAWVFDPSLLGAVTAAVTATPSLHIVTDHERRTYGLTNPEFGDLIAVLDEGLCFEPSTFARHIPAAMHGYHPLVRSQAAAFLHRGAHPPGPIGRTLEVFDTLRSSLDRA